MSNVIFCVFIVGHGFEHGGQDQPFPEEYWQRTVEDLGFCESTPCKGLDIGKLHFWFFVNNQYLLYDIFWIEMVYVQVIEVNKWIQSIN